MYVEISKEALFPLDKNRFFFFAWKHAFFHNLAKDSNTVELNATEFFLFFLGTHILSTWKQNLSEGQPVRELPRETWSGYFRISYTDKNQRRIRIIFFSIFRHSEWSQLRISATESSSQHLPSSQQEVCANVKPLHWWSCFYSAVLFFQVCTRGHGI